MTAATSSLRISSSYSIIEGWVRRRRRRVSSPRYVFFLSFLYYTNDFTVFLLTRATQLEATRQRLEEQAHKYLAAQTHEVNIPSYSAWFDMSKIHPVETRELYQSFSTTTIRCGSHEPFSLSTTNRWPIPANQQTTNKTLHSVESRNGEETPTGNRDPSASSPGIIF